MTHQPPRACEDRDACDKDSIELVLGGKPAAFEDIVRRYSRMIFGLSYRMFGSREDAADAVQDIFARVFTALEAFGRAGFMPMEEVKALIPQKVRGDANRVVDAIEKIR